MRYGAKGKYNGKLCSCPSATCRSIGYPNEGYFSLPSNATARQEWFRAMGWKIMADDMSKKENPAPPNSKVE